MADLHFFAFETSITKSKLRYEDVWGQLVQMGRHEGTFKNRAVDFRTWHRNGATVGIICSERIKAVRARRQKTQLGSVYPILKNPKTGDWHFNFFVVLPNGKHGIYGHSRGALPMSDFAKLVRDFGFNPATRIARKAATDARTEKYGITKALKHARSEFGLQKCFDLTAYVREGVLEDLLQDVSQFDSFTFRIPERDNDPFTNVREVATSVSSTVRFSVFEQKKRSVISAIKDTISQFSLKKGTVVGKKPTGGPARVHLDERVICLGSVDLVKTLPDDQINLASTDDELTKLAVFARIRDVFSENGSMFGGIPRL